MKLLWKFPVAIAALFAFALFAHAGSLNNPVTVGSGGVGDVVGPASSTDSAVARLDGTGGKTLQDSPTVTISDAGLMGVGAPAAALPLEISATTSSMQQTRYSAAEAVGRLNVLSAELVAANVENIRLQTPEE